ncbi:hypothetical protein ACFFX1_10230 [Dactylosporangium sucinum]|nr:hypothetical protein [Dactylosporangium sucinum]
MDESSTARAERYLEQLKPGTALGHGTGPVTPPSHPRRWQPMDEASVRQALLSVADLMPDAAPGQLTGAVMRAWNSDRDGLADLERAQADVVDAAWIRGYWSGAQLAHHHTVTRYHDRAMQELSNIARAAAANAEAPNHPDAVKVLRAVASAANAVADEGVAVEDPGPSHGDYATARAARFDDSHSARVAAAAAVGWRNGRRAGAGDATWSAGEAIAGYVITWAGAAVDTAHIGGLPARRWLARLQHDDAQLAGPGRTAAAQPDITPQRQRASTSSRSAFWLSRRFGHEDAAPAIPPSAGVGQAFASPLRLNALGTPHASVAAAAGAASPVTGPVAMTAASTAAVAANKLLGQRGRR